VDGVRQGFHGTASHEPWEVLEAGERSAVMRWRGYGLELERSFFAHGRELAVGMTFTSTSERTVPLATLEHVSFGLEILDPVLELDLPAAASIEVSDQDGPVRAPRDAPLWPDALRLDGSTERVDRVELRGEPIGRFLCVQNLPEGRATARGQRAGLELTWDTAVLRHAWVWYEVRAHEEPFRGIAEIVAVEPCSVPHSLGLARAVEEGQAILLEPGESISYSFGARILS
jgi:hypothetical protein